MDAKILDQDKIEPGDILLCYSSQSSGKANELQYGYSHVAICIDKEKIAHSSNSGVTYTTISSLLDEYDHIAVLRNDNLWDEERLNKLNAFMTGQMGKKFNLLGVKKFPDRKKNHKISMADQFKNYLEGDFQPPSSEQNVYFCSELIVAAFIDIGIINEMASIMFKPDTLSPEEIAKDPLYGSLIGYILSYDDYTVPEKGPFHEQYKIRVDPY